MTLMAWNYTHGRGIMGFMGFQPTKLPLFIPFPKLHFNIKFVVRQAISIPSLGSLLICILLALLQIHGIAVAFRGKGVPCGSPHTSVVEVSLVVVCMEPSAGPQICVRKSKTQCSDTFLLLSGCRFFAKCWNPQVESKLILLPMLDKGH